MNKRRILATIAAVLAVALAYDSFYIIDEAEQGVLTHFGKISPPVRQPGLHLKFPRPISKIYKVDRRIHTLDSLSPELITQDQKNVLVNGYMLWRVKDPIRYVEAIRTDANAINRLRDLYLSSSGIIVSNKARDAFVSLGLEHENLHVTSEDILARVSPTADTKYGVEVMRVGIAEYTLPPENRPSVIQRMIAERARIAARYRAEGEEAAIRIEAIAVKEHDQLMADAHAKATTILGNAEAKAMALLGAAYNEDPEF